MHRIFLISFIPLVLSQVCTNVYPHLSCGLSYSTQEECETVGCCWDTTVGAQNPCFAPVINGYRYSLTEKTTTSIAGSLTLSAASGIFSGDYQNLDLLITQETSSRTHLKITPTGTSRWEVPTTILPRPGGSYPMSDAASTVIITTPADDPNQPLELVISRQVAGIPTGELIFIFSKMLVFQDQYIQFVLGSASNVVASYGFGESTRVTQHLQDDVTYTLWNTDFLAAYQNSSLYGSHPFMIQVASDGKAHGLFFLNSNAMDISLANSDTQGQSIGFQVTGGLIDLYIFSGPSPTDVVSQYLEVIGRPVMMPYWSLGFHNCRYGYPNVAYVQEVVTNYSLAQIPLETQWMDIDYMDAYLDFTLDPVSFSSSDMTTFINSLHDNDQHFVPIIDPGIYVRDESYPAYTRGLEQNVFIKDMTNTQPYLGQVWPGPTYFPDWFAENATSWWTKELLDFHSLAAYDGLWIDMNEISNFCNVDGSAQFCVMNSSNPCDSTTCCLICSTLDSTNPYDFPPFVPHVSQGSLGGKTISMNSLHGDAGEILEYNAHNLYGFMESIATQTALHTSRPNQRAFMVSRSTYPGSGMYAAHWTGDNNSSWTNLRESIITMNNLALFGIPMVGADICGFLGNTNAELCSRWIEVGAFSPFSRNHNGLDQIPQELYRWENVAEASRVVLGLRYQLLPYLYTLLYQAHSTGLPVLNAMWMHFSTDPVTLFQDGQYLWSDSLLFTPVLTKGATSVSGYFPTGVWYSLLTSAANAVLVDSRVGGQSVVLDTPLEQTNVHMRGGVVIPMQNTNSSAKAMTTTAARLTPFTLLVALDGDGLARGSLYLDDGEQISLDIFSLLSYTAIPVDYSDEEGSGVRAAGGVFQSTAVTQLYSCAQNIDKIRIKGVSAIKGDFSATPDSCTASLTLLTSSASVSETTSGTNTAAGDHTSGATTVILTPEIIQYGSGTSAIYSELLIPFPSDVSLNIVSDFFVSWKCSASSGDDDSKGNSSGDDDEDGWEAIPTYGQALIIVCLLLVVVGTALGGYKLYLLHHIKSSDRDYPLLDETPGKAEGSLSIA